MQQSTRPWNRALGEVRREREIALRQFGHSTQDQRVYIWMLDPNQGVCGKRFIKLQAHGIDVSLFDPDLVAEITALDVEFVRTQQMLGVQILSPAD